MAMFGSSWDDDNFAAYEFSLHSRWKEKSEQKQDMSKTTENWDGPVTSRTTLSSDPAFSCGEHAKSTSTPTPAKAFVPDSIVQSVVDKFIRRAEFGKEKYNTTLDRTDLTPLEWIQHAQDELHDGILYLERLKVDHQKMERLVTLSIDPFGLSQNEYNELTVLRNWWKSKNQKS